MRYDLTRPCSKCPFVKKNNFPLLPARKEEIAQGLLMDGVFACHNTTENDDEGESYITRDSQHCAGAMIALEKLNKPNQGMRIAERFKMYDHQKLDKTIETIDLYKWAKIKRG